MVVIDGGGNDAADLVGAYLAAASDGGATLLALGSSLLGATAAGTTLAQTNGAALLGGQYMAALADTFYSSIKTNVLDKGAQHVVLLNIPGITNTPRFQMVLDGIASTYGGGTTGAAARAQSETLFKSWIEAFNTALAAKVGSDGRVVLVDVYAALNREVANPAQYGLQNAKDAVCPVTGLGSDGLPTYDFPTCTDSTLSATTPPAGATGGTSWWKTYLFSDGFHPTPYGHQLTYQQIALDLAKSGRL
jgi:phospholipase/lecithinase/hemolysin